jgi:hypothetical protein
MNGLEVAIQTHERDAFSPFFRKDKDTYMRGMIFIIFHLELWKSQELWIPLGGFALFRKNPFDIASAPPLQ